jgi:hypothetical protein
MRRNIKSATRHFTHPAKCRISSARQIRSIETTPLTVTGHRPHTTLVVTKRAQSLSVTREPHIDHIVLGGREEEIALGVEDDLGEGALVSLEDDRFLRGRTRQSAKVRQRGGGGTYHFGRVTRVDGEGVKR